MFSHCTVYVVARSSARKRRLASWQPRALATHGSWISAAVARCQPLHSPAWDLASWSPRWLPCSLWSSPILGVSLSFSKQHVCFGPAGTRCQPRNSPAHTNLILCPACCLRIQEGIRFDRWTGPLTLLLLARYTHGQHPAFWSQRRWARGCGLGRLLRLGGPIA